MKIENTANCPHCEKSLGRPQETSEIDGKMCTIYQCATCDGEWGRPHN